MIYNVIRFILVNFGEQFKKEDGHWGYTFSIATLLFQPLGMYPRHEKLTVGNFLLNNKPRSSPRTMKNEKIFCKLYDHANKHMERYEWDKVSDTQIIPKGFVFYREDCQFLDRDSVYIGFRYPRKRHWKMLNPHCFIGIHLRYGKDW